MTEQPTTEKPRPDEAVRLVADIVASLYGVVTVESIGETILRELAAAGRLLPEEGTSPAEPTDGCSSSAGRRP